MLILVLSNVLRFHAAPQLSLTMFEESLAEGVEALIEIFHREYNARSACKGLDFSTSISELCQEGLHKIELIDDIQMAVWVNRLV
jgi:hypothetical protein